MEDCGNKKTMLKVIVAGDCRVGKSLITRRFSGDDFTENYTPTISPKYSVKEVKTRGRQVLLQIWDTSGQDEFFEYLGSSFYRDVDCLVLMYDITNHSSFESLSKWLNEFQIHADARNLLTFPVVVVGSKADLKMARQVSPDEALQWCKSKSNFNNFVHLEVSSKNRSDAKRLFYNVARHCLTLDMIAATPQAEQQQQPQQPATFKKELKMLGCCCNLL